jgi:glutathione S-transferase
VLDDGAVLVESSVILDTLDEMVGPERALIPRTGLVRRESLRLMALATGFADKAVSLYLEPLFRKEPSERWIARCREQIADTLDVLEADRASRSSTWWLGENLGHVDITAACALGYLREAHPDFFHATRWPMLAAHAERADALEDFRVIYQPFVVRLGD